MNKYSVYAANLGGSLISGISEQEINPQLVEAILHTDGNPDPTYIGPMEAKPVIPFTSTEIAALLTLLGSAGWIVTGGGAIFYCQRMTEIGRSTGSDHLRMLVNRGVVIPEQLTAGTGQGGEARLRANCHCTWDGTNSPIVTSLAALAGTPEISKVYNAGPVKINGTLLGGVQNITVQFGVNLTQDLADGEGLPRDAFTATRDPIITITTTHVTALNTLGIAGTGITANVVAYLTRLKNDDQSLRYANNVAEHISLTMAAGRVSCRQISDDPQMAQIQVTPSKPTGSLAIVVNTAATIV